MYCFRGRLLIHYIQKAHNTHCGYALAHVFKKKRNKEHSQYSCSGRLNRNNRVLKYNWYNLSQTLETLEWVEATWYLNPYVGS